MNPSTPAEVARAMKGTRNLLVLAGSLCDEMELDGRKLLDYAADIALKLDAPVAATANTVVALKARGVRTAKKAAVQMVEMLRHEGWRDPVAAQRPEMLVLIGYPGEVARALVVATQGAQIVALGTSAVEQATYSLGNASQKRFQVELEEIIKGLA